MNFPHDDEEGLENRDLALLPEVGAEVAGVAEAPKVEVPDLAMNAASPGGEGLAVAGGVGMTPEVIPEVGGVALGATGVEQADSIVPVPAPARRNPAPVKSLEDDDGVASALEERNWLLANPYQPVSHQRALDDRAEARLIAQSQAMEEASRRERAGRLREVERDLQGRGVVGFAEDGSPRFKAGVVRPVVWDEQQNRAYRDVRDESGRVHRYDLMEVGEVGRDYKRDDQSGEFYVETPEGRRWLGRRDDEYLAKRHYQMIRDQAQADHGVDAAGLSMVRARQRELKGAYGERWGMWSEVEGEDGMARAEEELKKQVEESMAARKKAEEGGGLFSFIPGGQTREEKLRRIDEDRALADRGLEAITARREYDALERERREIEQRMLGRKMALAQAAQLVTARKYSGRGLAVAQSPEEEAERGVWLERYGAGSPTVRDKVVYAPSMLEASEKPESKGMVLLPALLDRAEAMAVTTGKSVEEMLPAAAREARKQGYEVPGIDGKRLYVKKANGDIGWGHGDPLAAISQAVVSGDLTPERGVKLFREHAPKERPKGNDAGRGQDVFWRTAIHTSNSVNRSLAGISRFLGADDVAEYFAANVRTGEGELDRDRGAVVNRDLDDAWTSTAAEVAGNVIAATPALAAGGPVGAAARVGALLPRLAGMLPLAVQGAADAYEATWQQSKKEGLSDDEADVRGKRAMVDTLPALALYGAAGAATDRLMRPLTRVLPVLETPFARAVGAGAVDLPLNIAADAVVMGARGENPLEMRAADLGTTIAFSFLPAMQHYEAARYLPTARALVDGSHPEVVLMRSVAADRSVDPKMRKLAYEQSRALKAEGERFVRELGAHPGRAAVEHLEATQRLRDLDAAADSAAVRDERASAAADANRALSEMVRSFPNVTKALVTELLQEPGRVDQVRRVAFPREGEGPGAAVLSRIGQRAIELGVIAPSRLERLRGMMNDAPGANREAVLQHAIGSAVFGDSYGAILRGEAMDGADLGFLSVLQEMGAARIDPETGRSRLNVQYLFLLPKAMRERALSKPDVLDAPERLVNLERIIREGHTGLEGAEALNVQAGMNRGEAGASASGPAMEAQPRRAAINIEHDAEGGFRVATLDLPPEPARGDLERLRAEAEALEIPDAAKRELLATIDERLAEGAPAIVEGPKLEGEWNAFSEESGTLGIPRAEMPQIKAEARGTLVNFLRARGVESTQSEVLPGELRPTQAEFSQKKVDAAKEFKGGDRALLVSSDGHVVDGHHQWMSKLQAEPEAPIRVIRLDAPIDRVLELAREFPSTKYAEGRGGEVARRVAVEDDGDYIPGLPGDPELVGTYARTKGEPKRFRREQVEGFVGEAKKKWKMAPDIEVIQGYDDLPGGVRDRYREMGVAAFYANGKVTLLADKVKNRAHAMNLALHEAVGHHGLRGVFGDRLPQELDKLALDARKDVVRVAERLGLDLREPAQRRESVEELIAESAERPVLRKRFEGWLKRKLQTVFKGLGFEDDAVRGMVEAAQRYVIEGKTPVQPDGEMRFSRRVGNLPTDEVFAPDGSLDWGTITSEMSKASKGAVASGPIRLLNGKHFGANRGYGLEHWLKEHGRDLQRFGFEPDTFLSRVLKGFTEIYKQPNGRIVLVAPGKPRSFGIVELRPEKGGFYSVVTAYPKDSPTAKVNGELIWRGRRAPAQPSASQPSRTAQERPDESGPKLPLEPLEDQTKLRSQDNRTSQGKQADSGDVRFSIEGKRIEPNDGKRYSNENEAGEASADHRSVRRGSEDTGSNFEDAAAYVRGSEGTGAAASSGIEEAARAVEWARREGRLIADSAVEANELSNRKLDGYQNEKMVLVREPTQIKSATGNRGTFDPKNPDIRFSREAVESKPAAEKTEESAVPKDIPLTDEEKLLRGAMVERGVKGWRRAFYGAADILERTRGLESIGRAVRNQVDRSRQIQGLATSFYRELERREGAKVFKAAEKEVEAYYREMERDPANAAKIYAAMSKAGRDHVEVWRGLSEWFAKRSDELNVQVQDGDGNWRKMGTIADYHPRMISAEFMDAIRDRHSHPKKFAELVEAMKKEGLARNEDEVISMLHRAGFNDTVRGDHFSNIEKARQLKLPHKVYDYSFDARRRYIMQAAERLSQIEHYGQRTSFSKDIFQKALEGIYDRGTAEYVKSVGEQALGIRQDTMLNRTMAVLNNIATGTMLSNPMSASLNLVSGVAHNAATTGFRNSLRALWDLPRYAKDAAEARDKGVLLDDLMDLMADTEASGSSLARKVNVFTNKALTLSGFNKAEEIVRATGYVAAKHWLREALEVRVRKPGSAKAQRAERLFRNLRVNADKIYKENGAGPETDKFFRAVINEAQGGYRIDQTPVYMNTPLGRFLTKYQKWGSQASRHFARNVLKPALAPGDGGRRDFWPAARYLFATGIAGGILSQLKEGVFGTADAEASFEEIAKTWSESEWKAIGLTWSKLTNSMILAGAGGMVMNYAQYAKDVTDRSRFKNPLDPPGLASAKNAGEQLMRAIEQKTLTSKDLHDYLRAQLSAYRTTVGMAGRAGWPIEKARQDRSWLAAQTRRFGEEVGLPVKRTDFGRIAKTVDSPVVRDLVDALMAGDAESAREAVKRYVERGDGDAAERERRRKSLMQSVRSRQPLKVGSAGEARREAFLDWAKRRLSEEDLDRVREIDLVYRKTAERIGLFRARPVTDRQRRHWEATVGRN